MRNKIYKWSRSEQPTNSLRTPTYFFDLYVDEHNLYSLNGFERSYVQIYSFAPNNEGIEIEESEVPEDIIKLAREFMEDPFFEIELEKYIRAQKNI